MTNKSKIVLKIEKTLNIVEKTKIEVPSKFTKELIELSNKIENFKVFLPIVGYFNAGKSSLLNSFIKKELLPTNIIPETAIATEIYFSTNEKIELFTFEKDTPFKTINNLDFSQIDTQNCDYIKVFFNSPTLKDNPVIFVDMPGFSSNIEKHNKSLFKYMQKEVSFVLIIDIEDGSLKLSTLRFLKEIKDYRLNFFVFLNKIDKKTPLEVEKIQEHIKRQLLEITDNPQIGKISSIDDKIDDFKNIINNIDSDDFVKNLFFDKVDTQIDSIILDLTSRKNAISFDTNEINNKISQLLEAQRKLHQELKKEKNIVEDKFSTTFIANLLIDIESSLQNNFEELYRAIETSQEAFSQKVNEIVRPIVALKLKNYSQKVFSETISNIEVNNKDIFKDIENVITSTTKTIEVIEPVLKNLGKVGVVLGSIFKRTQPLIIIISTIIDILSSFFKESEEEKARKQEFQRQERVKDELRNRIIPSIPKEIEPSIKEKTKIIISNFFKEIDTAFDEKFKDIQNSLEMSKKEREEKKNEIDSIKEEFTTLIKKLKDIKEI